MIQIEQVSFSYKEQEETLHNIDLKVKKGECILLCGESGCGKTTATKLINGLIPHFTEDAILQGNVRVDNLSVAETETYELAKHVGSVFQNPKSQFFNLDTDSELAFGLENDGVSPEVMKEKIEETVQNLGIQNLLQRNVFSLSGGEKQTLAFASVYAMKPAIYVLDEPSANLDVKATEKLRKQLLLLKEQGNTIVIAEHRLYFLVDFVDKAVYFQNGRIEKIFSGEEFRRLEKKERQKMGLRELVQTKLVLSEVRGTDSRCENGFVVENLNCGYGKEASVIQNLSFTAVPGEVLAITGANGAGKTTLTRCLCGLLKERDGKIALNGQQLKAKQRQKKCFLVMQDVNHQLFYDSVWNECEQAGGVHAEQIEEILQKFDLYDFKEQHPMALSGGQKQRLAVATALLSEKEILIFDEPTSGLDYRHMQEVGQVIRELAEQGKIVIVVSHDQEFMQAACDRVLLVESTGGNTYE